MNETDKLRKQIADVLDWHEAHQTFEATVADFPVALRGVRPAGLPHSAWELLEHMRIAQWDMLEFSRDPKHVSPEFPVGYWPASVAPPSAKAWDESVLRFLADREELRKLVLDPAGDLVAPFAHGSGQTLLREALLTADHNSHHVGQLIQVRRLLGAWK
jgi:DinB superfamily